MSEDEKEYGDLADTVIAIVSGKIILSGSSVREYVAGLFAQVACVAVDKYKDEHQFDHMGEDL